MVYGTQCKGYPIFLIFSWFDVYHEIIEKCNKNGGYRIRFFGVGGQKSEFCIFLKKWKIYQFDDISWQVVDLAGPKQSYICLIIP